VPYIAACWHPARHSLSLKEALTMQFIGLAGETAILQTLTPDHINLRSSILRFVSFDAAGLALLLLAFWILKQNGSNDKTGLQHQKRSILK
jgi:hypothetical protein